MTEKHVAESAVVHPVVVVKVERYKCLALLDSGTSYSYCSLTFVKLVKARLKAAGLRQIAMFMGDTMGEATKTLQEFDVTMHAVTDNFQLDVNVTKIDKRELLLLENPCYEKVLAEHPHLRGVYMDDDDEKAQLPVHLTLGANDFAKIRTGAIACWPPLRSCSRIHEIWSPGAETDPCRLRAGMRDGRPRSSGHSNGRPGRCIRRV